MPRLKSSASGRVMWGFVSGVGIQAAEYTEPIRKGKGTLALSREVQIQPSMGNTPSLAVMILADGFARRVATDVVRYSMDVTPQSSVDSQTQLKVDVEGKFQDRIKIDRIAPEGDLRLKSGTPVDLEFRIDYELTSLKDVELEVQFHDRKMFGSDYRVVHRGIGSFTVTRRIVPSKDSGTELSVSTILAIPPVGSDKLTYTISPD